MTVWTKETPKESGFYWWREDADDDYLPLLVHIGQHSSCVWLSNNTGTSFDSLAGEWWPIRLPTPSQVEALDEDRETTDG